MLSSEGYEPAVASGGQEGLDLIRKLHPHLVLLDMMMPEVSGEDVLREVKGDAEIAHIPVVLY